MELCIPWEVMEPSQVCVLGSPGRESSWKGWGWRVRIRRMACYGAVTQTNRDPRNSDPRYTATLDTPGPQTPCDPGHATGPQTCHNPRHSGTLDKPQPQTQRDPGHTVTPDTL